MSTSAWVAGWSELDRLQRTRLAGWAAVVAVLSLAFAEVLARLFTYALGSHLHSHIPLVPVIALYLLLIQPRWSGSAYRTSPLWAGAAAAAGAAALASALTLDEQISANDYFTLMALAYVSFFAASGFLFLGFDRMRAAAMPMLFLLFIAPLPDAAVDWLEMASVRRSADVSELMFRLSGTPLLRDGTVFTLPGIVLEVARECSGIRSSWVLFITSVAASSMLLTSPWRRLALVAFVIPLAIVRNAVRIVTIGLLCVHVGPHMADSAIHRQGGPVFFALSLLPLFALLWWLRRQDRGSRRSLAS